MHLISYKILESKMTQLSIEQIKSSIATVPNYPKPGIMFRDVTTLMADPKAFKSVIDMFAQNYKDKGFT